MSESRYSTPELNDNIIYEYNEIMKKRTGHEYWYFFVKDVKDIEYDKNIAEILRNHNNHNFNRFLEKKYGWNWLEKSKNTEYDCLYLSSLRDQREMRIKNDEYNEEDDYIIFKKEQSEIEELVKEMSIKLKRKEISIDEYNDFVDENGKNFEQYEIYLCYSEET
jgi:hypothetical protein